MIYFIESILVLGLIAFPIIKGYLGGAIKFTLVRGFVLGVNQGSVHFSAKVDGEKKVFKMNTIQFHLGFFTSSMSHSKEIFDYEIL